MKVKYVVIYCEHLGKFSIKNKIFDTLLGAEQYADEIDSSRNPTIIPYIPMYPRKNGEFRCDDFGAQAEMLEEIHDLFLFSSDTAGATPMAEHHTIIALNLISNAVQHFHMAALAQAEAVTKSGR